MPTRIFTPQYRDEQGEWSLYPFADGATLVTDTGLLFPADSIIDAIIYPPGADATTALSGIEVAEGSTTLRFGMPGREHLATAYVTTTQSADRVVVLDRYGRPAGILVVDPVVLTSLQGWSRGVHALALGAAPLVPRCVVPRPEVGVRALIAEAPDPPRPIALAGPVALLGYGGVVVRSPSTGVIEIDAVGEVMAEQAACRAAGGTRFAPGWPIRTLTLEDRTGAQYQITPDELGTIQLVPISADGRADPALRIAPDGASGVVFESLSHRPAGS